MSAPAAVRTATAPTVINPGRAGRRRRPWDRYARRAASVLAALALWQLLAQFRVTAWLRFSQFPTVIETGREFVRRLGGATYWQDLTDSLTRIIGGFALAAVLGVALGTAVARSPVVSDLLGPLLEVLRPIPAIALVPVAILLFPSNEQGIVFITFAAAFFPVTVSTRHAVRALTPVWEEAVRTMGGGRWRVLWSVVLPGALPGIFGGLSVGIGVSWICVISAEMISGEYGVGYRTWQDYTIVDYPGVFVGMATIGLLGWLTSTAVEVLGRRVTRWLPRTATGPSRNPGRRSRQPARPETGAVRARKRSAGPEQDTAARGVTEVRHITPSADGAAGRRAQEGEREPS
ncbi:ABC transporter permease [Streptomyces sp. NPDC101150]|uniref:ABC transporter permease n=1 Tax=Streptomyces sp. NPDC101150 TaxID=3366114 RepID=UPI0038015313